MKKTISLLLSILLLVAALPMSTALAANEPTVYSAIAMQMTEPDGFEEAGLMVLHDSSLLNIGLMTDNGFLMLTAVLRITEGEMAAMQQDGSIALLEGEGMQILGQMDGYTYLLLHIGHAPSAEQFFMNIVGVDYNSLPADVQQQMQDAIPLLNQAVATLEPISQQSAMQGVFTFSTTDLYGNPVSSDIFSQADLTIINVWGTFCGPCIGEMPALAAWDKQLPDNVQIIGVLCDVEVGGDTSAALSIVNGSGVTYMNLLYNNSLIPLLNQSQYVPTTYFVDRNGNMVCEPIVGADVEGYKAVVNDYLNK